RIVAPIFFLRRLMSATTSSATAVLMRSLPVSSHLVRAPDAETEAIQVDVLAAFALAGVGAIKAQPQEGPRARLLAAVVVPMRVAVGLHHPSPGSAVRPAVARLLLPALEHPLGHLDRGTINL